MVKYIVTNENGYVTGVTSEPSLIGLHGGVKTALRIQDDRAEIIQELLRGYHSKGEGLHIDEVRRLEGQRN